MKSNKNIVFIHGSSSSSKVFKPVIQVWNRAEKLIPIELPGHGDSANADDYSWRLTKKYLLDRINKIEGEIFLIGNSVGGHLAIEIAPKLLSLKGLATLGSPPLKKPLNLEEAFSPNPYSATYYKESPNNQELKNSLYGAVFNHSVIPILREDFLKTDAKVRSTLLKDIMDGNDFLDEAEIVRNLTCKKYFINGKQDPSINFEYLQQIQKDAPFPIELIEIDNCGHYPTLEQPEIFLTILEKILDKIFI